MEAHDVLASDLRVAPAGSPTHLASYSISGAHPLNKEGDGWIHPIDMWLETADASPGLKRFSPERHVLLRYDLYIPNIDPRGLSGSGAWAHVPMGDSSVWTPNIRLVGVQSSYYPRSNFLKVIRIKRIAEFLGGVLKA